MVYEYEYDEQTQKMRINCMGAVHGSSIEDFPVCMAKTIDNLMELKKVAKIVLADVREYEYDFNEARMLLEIANVIEKIIKEKIISINNVILAGCETESAERYGFLQKLLNDLRSDPIEGYKQLLREIRKNRVRSERESGIVQRCHLHYISSSLNPIKNLLENCRLIQLAIPQLTEHKDRALYRKIFHPTIRPNFIYTKYVSLPPPGSELVERYKIGDTDVEIYKIYGKVRKFYHIVPPEFKLNENEYMLLDTARRYLGRHEPRETELAEPSMLRENLYRIGLDMIRDLASSQKYEISEAKLEKLASILSRYTAGLGILDLILQDENIQDIVINSPVGLSPAYIFHGVHEECETNIVPSSEDAETWATRFRLFSGRPLDEANPVLDTELIVPGGRARVAAITRTLSPDGLAFAFRRHRDKPWTFPLFIKNKMIDPFAAGLMWFLIDGARTLLIAGTRSSGKSSFLGACMVQIMPKIRIITTEDSVTGDCQIFYSKNNKIEKSTVSELIDAVIEKYGCDYDFGREVLRKNSENIKVFSMGKNGKIKLSEISAFIRHKTKKDIFEITTRTGRKIKVTGDHSLFSLDRCGKITPVKVRNLRIEDYLAVPRILPFENNGIETIDLFDYFHEIEHGYIEGEKIKELVRSNRIIKKYGSKSNLYHWSKGVLPIKVVKELTKQGFKLDTDVKIKFSNNSKSLPRLIKLDKEFLEFLGLWLADGCYDKNSVIISVVDEGSRNVVRSIAKRFGINVRMHSDGISLVLHSGTLKNIMKIAGFTGNAYTKQIPRWVFDLSKDQLSHFLRGIFSGDGYLAYSEAAIGLASENMIKDIQSLLLMFGIISRINRMDKKDKTYSCRISQLDSLNKFKEIGFLQQDRMIKLSDICKKISTHDSTDVIPLSEELKRTIKEEYHQFSYTDYITRGNNVGRKKLVQISKELQNSQLTENLSLLANSDIFWDQIREIKRLDNNEEWVYDLSVPECESFVCENIIAHNTLELPFDQLRELGYNIERLKSRSVITHIETELPAEEALRTALRLGDSALIVGEIRSKEALALYEAMRIGALANVVAGTIHGDSAYGVFDRVVNDLGVPPTSFKATDIILIANMLRSPEGLHAFRRVVEITEVRKHWKHDPFEEGGFVNLFEYSAKDDFLKPTKTLSMGESEILNDITMRVRDWKGNWNAVWNNIRLRAKIMENVVDYAAATNKPQMLEAPFVIASNSMFHLASSEVKEERGDFDNKAIYEKWHMWMKKWI